MPAAFRADPELVRLPGVGRDRIAQLHLRAAALTPDLQTDFAHGLGILYDSIVIPAIVLAAGKSSRMGRSKATLPLDGDTFLTRIVRTLVAAGVEDVVIVVGHDADAIVESCAHAEDVVARARFVDNPHYEDGQFSSLLAGLQAVDRPGVAGVLLTLVDVPLVSQATVRAVLDCYQRTAAPIVRPVRGDQHGHPVLIDRSLFDRIRRADPSQGVKPIIRANASAAGDVVVDDPGAFADADTPEDYEQMLRRP